MSARQKALVIIGTIRFIASLAMLGVVVAGALGFDDAVKLCLAAGGAAAAVGLKAAHIIV